jgi:diguanylate cyclase (GGDEF)-like protein/PAS domain S-box-containing protein
MDNEGKPLKDLADELESLREEITHLQRLIQNPVSEAAPGEDADAAPAAPAVSPEMSMLWQPGLLDTAPFGLALVDIQFRILNANHTFCRMLGYTEQEILSLHIRDIAHNANACMQQIGQVFDAVAPVSKIEGQFLRRNKEVFWAQCTVSEFPVDRAETKCCLLVLEDITARKCADEAIRTERQLLERLINSSVDGIFAFDRDCFFTVWNPGMERIFGVSAKEALGKHAFKACPFLKELGEDANFAAALKGEKRISRDKTIPGTKRQQYFEGFYGPMLDPHSGEAIGGLAIIRDVTERKLAEEAKRVSESRYEELFENAHDMVYTHDMSGKITSINKAAERITGYTRAEALRMKLSQLVAPEFQQAARRMIDGQLAAESAVAQELDILTKDGSRVTLEVSNRLIFQQGKAIGIQGIARDITERKKTEEALQGANKKLEAWVHDLEQRTREMTLLSEMGDILRACLSTEEVYEVIVRVAQEVFPVLGGALYVLGPLRNIVESVAEWGDTSQIELTFAPDECWALRRGKVHCVEDTRVGLLCKHVHPPLPKGYMCVPMMAQSEAVGILHLAQPADAQMPEAKQRLAIAMAEHVAMALSNLRLHETLRNQSIRDQMTGLFNRSFMEESLELELRRAVRTQHPLSVIMLSLDNFQILNDNYGVDVGDSILRRTGMLLQGNIRKGDIACRFSSQTFTLILPNAGFEVSKRRAEILLDQVRGLEVKNQSELVDHISASVGLAVFPENGQTVDSLLRSAEAALSRARGGGGNQVVIAI